MDWGTLQATPTSMGASTVSRCTAEGPGAGRAGCGGRISAQGVQCAVCPRAEGAVCRRAPPRGWCTTSLSMGMPPTGPTPWCPVGRAAWGNGLGGCMGHRPHPAPGPQCPWHPTPAPIMCPQHNRIPCGCSDSCCAYRVPPCPHVPMSPGWLCSSCAHVCSALLPPCPQYMCSSCCIMPCRLPSSGSSPRNRRGSE